MESTGVYWKPIYKMLENTDLELLVVNAQHIKAVPGRKTDVKDAEWIADLLKHGLVRPSYIPSRPQRELRELVRYRKGLVEQRSHIVQRIQKLFRGSEHQALGRRIGRGRRLWYQHAARTGGWRR